jgi:phosphoketolase
LAIENEIDRFTLAIDVIDRVPKLQTIGAHAKEKLRNQQINLPALCARTRNRYARNQRLEMAVLDNVATGVPP